MTSGVGATGGLAGGDVRSSRLPPREPRFTWNALLWSLVYPQRAHRILPTLPGTVLIGLSLGIGMAAYNSSSNILFLTLALLLTCLVLSGVLSWLNLRQVTWELRTGPALRVGHDALVGLELRNRKSVIPTYGLWFNLLARPVRAPGTLKPESTMRASGADIRAALAQAEASEIRGRVALAQRLDPNAAERLDWVLQPRRRGWLRIELESVGSLFPFGFLRKDVGTRLALEAIVWPAVIQYRRHAQPAIRRQAGDERVARAGSGNDLLAVRRYQPGDSHRLIHWKASARTQQLQVRQFSAEISQGHVLWVRTDRATWPRDPQFELLVQFAATLAEDLFRAGRLLAVAVNDRPAATIRRLHDLEHFLNQLATIERIDAAESAAGPSASTALLTFAPDGSRGVGAYANGQLVASA